MASWIDIPGGGGPSKGMGRVSNALLRSSGDMFNQSGTSDKNWAIGPDSAVGNFPAKKS